jgi:hypothetical protein
LGKYAAKLLELGASIPKMIGNASGRRVPGANEVQTQVLGRQSHVTSTFMQGKRRKINKARSSFFAVGWRNARMFQPFSKALFALQVK